MYKCFHLQVHRKGATRAFPPHHPLIPVDYQLTGQPVLIGGTMGTCSYVLSGTEKVIIASIRVTVVILTDCFIPHFNRLELFRIFKV